MNRRVWFAAAGILLAGFACATWAALEPLPELSQVAGNGVYRQVLARGGEPLNETYGNAWNLHTRIPLHDMPHFLQSAFVTSEDRRFYLHGGVDWRARLAAVYANIRHGRSVRGASTISEQVVRMLHPRPRSLWSRWLEGFEAGSLEKRNSKSAILEFYLNQVPFAANRRGVAQAAQHYFNRDVDTLSKKEMMALAVLVRAPSRMDLYKSTDAVDAAIGRLNTVMKADLSDEVLQVEPPKQEIHAPHFVQAAQRANRLGELKVLTTLDADLQRFTQTMLDGRLKELAGQHLRHGAVLIADHTTGEILAWAVGDNTRDASRRTQINAVLAPRQPGSALKPFLYATAFEMGWTPATLIDDSPLTEMVGLGIHDYQNYSHRFYGPMPARQTLGNSLNIPALKALQFVGTGTYLTKLHRAGFTSLTLHPDEYGDGLALGNGEVSLFELVQGYATLANKGRFRPLHMVTQDSGETQHGAFTETASSLIGNILSDPMARQLEFGQNSVLNLPVQTAVKTGTSSDYRDAWAVGYNYRYVVGIWMGNLDQTPTDGITGSTGPALLLRSLFARLNGQTQTRPLYLSPALTSFVLCRDTMLRKSDRDCAAVTEWFDPAFPPADAAPAAAGREIRLKSPTPGLNMAYDPRIPADKQFFEFVVEGTENGDEIRWTIDGTTTIGYQPRYLWQVRRGKHQVAAEVHRDGGLAAAIAPVAFIVK